MLWGTLCYDIWDIVILLATAYHTIYPAPAAPALLTAAQIAPILLSGCPVLWTQGIDLFTWGISILVRLLLNLLLSGPIGSNDAAGASSLSGTVVRIGCCGSRIAGLGLMMFGFLKNSAFHYNCLINQLLLLYILLYAV